MSFKIFWEQIGEEQALKAKNYLNELFASIKRPDFIGEIMIRRFHPGTIAPIVEIIDISDPKDSERIDPKQVEFKVHLGYRGNAYITIETELLVNWPVPKFVCLPVVLTVSNFFLEGVACLAHKDSQLIISFEDDGDNLGPLKDLQISPEIGDKNQNVLKNVEKLEKFIIDQLRTKLKEQLVQPNYLSIDIGLPDMNNPH